MRRVYEALECVRSSVFWRAYTVDLSPEYFGTVQRFNRVLETYRRYMEGKAKELPSLGS